MLLDPGYRRRFKYSVSTEHKGTPRGMPKSPAFQLPIDTWEIDFDETGSPTVIQGDGQDAKSHGRVWVDPATSRVLMTELIVEAKTLRATIRVSYQSETHTLKGRFYTFEGEATYSNFRRFAVNTVESIGDPK
jgi:hypothetical protein